MKSCAFAKIGAEQATTFTTTSTSTTTTNGIVGDCVFFVRVGVDVLVNVNVVVIGSYRLRLAALRLCSE